MSEKIDGEPRNYWTCPLSAERRYKCEGYIEYGKCSGECPAAVVAERRTTLLWLLLLTLWRMRIRKQLDAQWKMLVEAAKKPIELIEPSGVEQEMVERVTEDVAYFQRKVLAALMVPAEFLWGHPRWHVKVNRDG